MKQKEIVLYCGIEFIVIPALFSLFVKICQLMGIKKFNNKNIKITCVFKRRFWKSKFQKEIKQIG